MTPSDFTTPAAAVADKAREIASYLSGRPDEDIAPHLLVAAYDLRQLAAYAESLYVVYRTPRP